MEKFDPKNYWESRLRRYPNIRGTGQKYFSLGYNETLYSLAFGRLKHAFSITSISLSGKNILDAGISFGSFIPLYESWGVGSITGIDIAIECIKSLRNEYPSYQFIQGDISAKNVIIDKTFYISLAINLMFHIVDDTKFNSALENLCDLVKPGGYLVIVDTFKSSLVPATRHTKFRDISSYQRILSTKQFKICTIQPMFYIMGRSYIPFLGPVILSWPPIIRLSLYLENKLFARKSKMPGGLKILISQLTP